MTRALWQQPRGNVASKISLCFPPGSITSSTGSATSPTSSAADNPLTYTADDSYSLEAGSPTHPAFLHFIGNTSKPGWRNWDQAEAKLAASKLPAAEVALP